MATVSVSFVIALLLVGIFFGCFAVSCYYMDEYVKNKDEKDL